LKSLGLGDDIKKIGVSSYSHHSYSSNGDLLGAYGVGVTCTNSLSNKNIDLNNEVKKENEKHNIHIPRQALRELLLKNINPNNIKWNKKLIKFDDSHGVNEEVKLYFEDGCEDSASLLISADGIHSK
jgi:2-polyprenyl-6-methoxyphenol hydroxylase-like FAD-dependent oxidoreductase